MLSENAEAPDVTFVCCIEFGRLEEQTVLLVRSLRTFGGALSAAPIIAVKGRIGAPLRKRTHDELHRLGVKVVRAKRANNPAPWLNYANKIAAVVTAEQCARTGQITWIDSDIFVIDEPGGLLLNNGEQLAAQCHPLPPAVLEGDDSHVDYWRRILGLFKVEFESIPWISGMEGYPRQKLNFTSGVFTWKKGLGFAKLYSDAVKRVLAGHIAQRTGEFFTVDQVVFTPLIVRHGLRWRNLSAADHTIVLGGFLEGSSGGSPVFSGARLLHYSNSFAPEYRTLMERKLERELPRFWAWLKEQDLDLGPTPRASRAVAAILRALRGFQYRAYARSTVRAK